MKHYTLKTNNTKRKKALFGADGAIMAAAVIAQTAAQVGLGAAQTVATINAAKDQAAAIKAQADSTSHAIKMQNDNNNLLQQKSIDFTKQQNTLNRNQQKDIQTTLQLMAGQENYKDQMEKNKAVLKYGGKPYMTKRKSLKNTTLFQVTDGGGVIPLQTDDNGYGLYELYGNDHEHYHKAPGGKHKTGVGIKFNNGSVVEGEGNQNTDQGELLYVTPTDALFLSKHSIKGFNPTKAVKSGIHPIDAFVTQEYIKSINGYEDDGNKTRKSLKKLAGGQLNVLANDVNLTQLPSNNTGNVANGAAYLNGNKTEFIAKCGKRINLKRHKANDGYALAGIQGLGNVLGAIGTTIGNSIGSKYLTNANNYAAQTITDAYNNMKGIDISEIKASDYDAPISMAAIRTADTNINPQIERLNRNARNEKKAVNQSTMSSAVRQKRMAQINDNLNQRMDEIYATKHNADEAIKQQNAQRITQVSADNANRQAQARQAYNTARLNVMQYNNDIENAKLAGVAEASSAAALQNASIKAQNLNSTLSSWSNAINSTAQNFINAYSAKQENMRTFQDTLIGLDENKVAEYAISRSKQTGDISYAESTLEGLKRKTDAISMQQAAQLEDFIKSQNKKAAKPNTKSFKITTPTPGSYTPTYAGGSFA